MRTITIAIDGYSSTGKSTVARQLADWLDYLYVDSGAMYRAVTLFALRKGLISETDFNKEALIETLSAIELEFRKNSEGKSEIHLNGENVEKQIRTLEVSEHVSPVATVPEVRRKLVKLQHAIGENKGVVMDGRDIGTVVFPNAELKIFMNASAKVRAQRRYEELLERGDSITFQEVLDNVTERDHIDTHREDSPLVKAKDAIEIDNTETNIEDQFHIILQLAKDRIAGRI
ncbi:MAG: (d)CMP kinase [Bacteroidia bacterium]|nr:(d)CMP kinase [Bacteroidia bacterium]MBT8274637.1 (d)CMP kinase [Bacteroidia bacterium]NNJ82022.1 (d)CMP kinase [Flavobacteriaceae bacterium]NNK55643.1 (d)CMP kinase [Flavobacteriaceae bacterium]NNM08374.1 (d)CMP kinase [Flavobacteriaceae bacterium]